MLICFLCHGHAYTLKKLKALGVAWGVAKLEPPNSNLCPINNVDIYDCMHVRLSVYPPPPPPSPTLPHPVSVREICF